MKIKHSSTYLWIIFIFIACGTESNKNPQIKPGTYVEFGERQIKQDSIISEGLAGVYFQQIFTFEGSKNVKVKILSDYPPEVGTALGNYKITNGNLDLHFSSSSTSFYKEDTTIEFDQYQIVDSTFSSSFSIDNYNQVFSGPGLILSKHSSQNPQIIVKDYFRLQ